jgi:hypothetical protein
LKKEVFPRHLLENIAEFQGEYIQAKNASALSGDSFAGLNVALELHLLSQSEIMQRKKTRGTDCREKRWSQIQPWRAKRNI